MSGNSPSSFSRGRRNCASICTRQFGQSSLLRAEVPEDAFTASVLGTERSGNAVLIRQDGLLLTIGYLITEAESIWLTGIDGTVVPGHPLAFDYATGFGLVLPLGQLACRRCRAVRPAQSRPGRNCRWPTRAATAAGQVPKRQDEAEARGIVESEGDVPVRRCRIFKPARSIQPRWSGGPMVRSRPVLADEDSIALSVRFPEPRQ